MKNISKKNEEKAKRNLEKKLFPKFPTTDKEVEEFEKNNDIESVVIPEKLKSPMTLLKFHRINCVEYGQKEHYYLKKGDIIKKGDEIDKSNDIHSDANWQIATTCIGEEAPDPQYIAHRQYRRIIGNIDCLHDRFCDKEIKGKCFSEKDCGFKDD